MELVKLVCDECNKLFEQDAQIAAIQLEKAADPDFDSPILCHPCTLEAMVEEEEEDYWYDLDDDDYILDMEDEIDRKAELMERDA